MLNWFLSLFKAPDAEPIKPSVDRNKDREVEWLVLSKSGIEHKFVIVPSIHNSYRAAACGFMAEEYKLDPGPGIRKCPKCLNHKGW